MLPPLTLLKVVNVQQPGEWEYLPGKKIAQKLITVRPTYMLPAERSVGVGSASKFASDRTLLTYGTTKDANSDNMIDPTLTMAQEWARNDIWCDWRGNTFSAWEQWEYVINKVPANTEGEAMPFGGAGHRDRDHEGMGPSEFLRSVNSYVEEQAKDLALMEDEYVLLTRDEVLAIRLYTGPGYQPINTFLREMAKLSPNYQPKLAHVHTLTYSSTVLHLTNGLRKLVRVNTNSSFASAYRTVRGELGEDFWHKDDFGDITGACAHTITVLILLCSYYCTHTAVLILLYSHCCTHTALGRLWRYNSNGLRVHVVLAE
jgi:hypothetical protein